MRLTPAQRAFAAGFGADTARRTRLLASPGSGKTTIAAYVAKQCVQSEAVKSVLYVSENRASAINWYGESEGVGLQARLSIDEFVRTPSTTFAATTTVLSRDFQFRQLLRSASSNPTLIVHDDSQDTSEELLPLIHQLVNANQASRYLALFSPYQGLEASRFERDFEAEYFLDRPAIALLPTEIEVARFSPSYPLLQQLLTQTRSIDELGWREFERLIAELLAHDGYTVELMQGSKDGGVDVVAVKTIPPGGQYKTLWQAKKKQRGKVGLEVVRELADTRNELGASKAMVVTSTYLTRGALQRIERDRFMLGKVDRGDLESWISRVLMGKHGA